MGLAACLAARDAAVGSESPPPSDPPAPPLPAAESVVDGCRADDNLPLRKSEMEAAADFGASGMALELIAVKAYASLGGGGAPCVEAGRPLDDEEGAPDIRSGPEGGKYSASERGVVPR